MKIQPVPLELVHQVWPKVEGWIEDAILYGGGDYTLDQIQLLVSNGSWLLLVATDGPDLFYGAATVSFSNMPNDRVAFITFIGGKLISSQDTFKQLINILKAHGATKIQGAARESVARLWRRYGFEERHVIVEKRI
jgi:hypothetical protein